MKTGPKSLGTAIRTLRRERGLDQEHLARRAGIHRTYLSKVERDHDTLSATVIQKISRALHTDPMELLVLAGKCPPELIAVLRSQPPALTFLKLIHKRPLRPAAWISILQHVRRLQDLQP